MTQTVLTRSFIGKGKVYAGLKAGGANLPLGNVSKLALAISEEKKELLDYTSAGGGMKDTLTRISSITGSMTVHDYSPENLAFVLRGEVDTQASDAVPNETGHTAYTNGFVEFNYVPDVTATITPVINVSATWAGEHAYVAGDCILANSDVYQCTTAGSSAVSEPTWSSKDETGETLTDGTVVWTNRGAVAMVDGTDYTLGKAGLSIDADASRFAEGLPIKISYTKMAAEITQMLTQAAPEYVLFFDGLNEADSGNPFYVKLHRVKFGVTSGLDMIGDDFAGLEVSFDVLQDTTISGTGISQYLKIAQVAA